MSDWPRETIDAAAEWLRGWDRNDFSPDDSEYPGVAVEFLEAATRGVVVGSALDALVEEKRKIIDSQSAEIDALRLQLAELERLDELRHDLNQRLVAEAEVLKSANAKRCFLEGRCLYYHGQRGALEKEIDALRFESGQLRSQNAGFRDASRVLVESLEGAWWRRASEAYDRLVIMVNDEPPG